MCAGNAPGDVSDTVAFLHDYLRVTSHTTHHSPSNTPPAPYALHTPSRPAPPLPKDDNNGNVAANTPQPQAETVLATITTRTTTPVEDTNAIELPRRYSWRRQVGSLAIHQTTVVEADMAAAQHTTTTTPHKETQRKVRRSTPRASSRSSSEKEAQHVTTAAAPRRSIVPHIRTAAASHKRNEETPHHHHSLMRNTHLKISSGSRHHAVPRRSAPQLFESSTSSAWQHSLSRPAIIPPPGPLQEEERSRSVLLTRVPAQHDRQTRQHPLAFTPPPSASHSLLTSGSPHKAQHNKYYPYNPNGDSSSSSRHTRLRSSTMRQRTNGASRSEQLSFVPVQSIEAIYKQNNSTRDHASTKRQHRHHHRSYQSSAPHRSKASALPMTDISLVFPPHSSPSHSSASSSASHSAVLKRKHEARSHSEHHHYDHHHTTSHSLHNSRCSSGQRAHSTSHASSSHVGRRHRHTARVEDSTQTPAQQQPHIIAKNAASTSTSQAAINAPLSLIESGAEHSTILRHMVSYLKSYYARDATVEAQRGIETMSSEDLLGLMQCIYMDFYHLIRTMQLRRGLDVVQTGYAAPDPTPLITASASSTIRSVHHRQPHRHASSSSNAASLLRGRSSTHPPTRHEDVPSPTYTAHHSSSRRSSASASAHVSRHSSHKSRHSHAVQPAEPTTTAPQLARSHSSHKPATTTTQQQQNKGNNVQVIQAKVPVFVSPCSSPRSTVLSSSPPLSSNRGGPSPVAAKSACTPMPNARLPQALNCAVNRPYSVSSHSHTSSSLSTSAPCTHSSSTSRATRHHHHLSSHHHSHKSNTPARQYVPYVRTSQADGTVNSAPSHSLHTGDTQGRTPLRHAQGHKEATAQHTTSERQRQEDTFMLHKAASSLRTAHQRKTPSPRKSVSIAPSVTVTSSSLNNNNNNTSHSSESGVSRLQSLMSQLRQGVNALKYIAHNRPPHLRYFRVEDRFASFRGSGVLMPHLVWKPLNQGGVGLNTSSASARVRAEGLNLIQLRAVTRGSGSGPACPGYELFYRRHGHVIDRKGDVVPEHLCAVLVFTAKTIAVSFLREQDQLLWMEALTGVVQRNQTLRF